MGICTKAIWSQSGAQMNFGLAPPFWSSKAQESNHRVASTMRNEQPSKFTWIYAAGAVILVLIAIFAVTFAFQEHNDRVLTDEINGTAWELQDAGARITGIRDADM